MKKYDELTELGKIRRMHKAAKKLVEQYDIKVKEISYITEETNMFFKVTSSDGRKYALKICQEESSKLEDNLAEVYLIETVSQNTDITVPEVVRAKNGDAVSRALCEGFDEAKRGILYNWIDGREIDGREDNNYFIELGKTAAKLHLATRNISIPEDISPKKWDKVFYYRDEVPVYKEQKYQSYLSPKYHESMDFMIPYLNEKLAAFYNNTSSQLLHADLNPYNVWTYKNEIRVIDFEEAMLGLPVHDLAIALFYYRYDKNFIYNKVKDTILEGYSSVLGISEINEKDIELLMTARRVNFLNYVLLVDDNPAEYIKINTERLMEYIKNYV